MADAFSWESEVVPVDADGNELSVADGILLKGLILEGAR
jgi:hypothetical protein